MIKLHRLSRGVLVRGVLVCLTAAIVGPSWSLAQGLPPGEAQAVGFDPPKLAKIQAMLDDAVRSHAIPGGAALVARKGQVALLATAGQRDIEAGKAFAADTIVRIASMSKPVTSVAVMILADEGKLSIDDPVAKYLPEFTAMSVIGEDGKVTPAKTPITIKHLLTHTSGLSYRFLNHPRVGPLYIEAGVSDGLSETPGTIGDNIKRLARVPLIFEPGTQFHYSLSTDVLGRLVEVASGRTFDEFLRERIFEPLKMNDTGFRVPAEKRDRLAAVYEPTGETIQRLRPEMYQQNGLVYSPTYPTWQDGHYFSGGAGMVSTIGDYARFSQMMANDGELDGVRILKPETVALMTKDQLGSIGGGMGAFGSGFGLGFGVVGEAMKDQTPATVGSYSWAGFFATYFWVDPEKDIVGVLVTQMYPAPRVPLAEQFQKLTYEAVSE